MACSFKVKGKVVLRHITCAVLMCVSCAALCSIESDLYRIYHSVNALSQQVVKGELAEQGVSVIFSFFQDDFIRIKQNHPEVAMKNMPMAVLLKDNRVFSTLLEEIIHFTSSEKSLNQRNFPAIDMFKYGLSDTAQYFDYIIAHPDVPEMNADEWIEYLENKPWWSYHIYRYQRAFDVSAHDKDTVAQKLLDTVSSVLYDVQAQDAVVAFRDWFLSDFLFAPGDSIDIFKNHYMNTINLLNNPGIISSYTMSYFAFYEKYIHIYLQSHFLVSQKINAAPGASPDTLGIEPEQFRQLIDLFYNISLPFTPKQHKDGLKKFTAELRAIVPLQGLSWMSAIDFATTLYFIFINNEMVPRVIEKQDDFISYIENIFNQDVRGKQAGLDIRSRAIQLWKKAVE